MKKALFVFLLLFPTGVFAAAQDMRITEIFYDADGNDTDHEWVELWNGGSDSITIDNSWRFDDGGKDHHHKLSIETAQGTIVVAPSAFVILAQDSVVFLADHQGFSGTIIQVSAMSLLNSGGTLALRVSDGTTCCTVSYSSTWGGTENGKTLEWNRETGAWSESANVGGTPGSFGTSGSTPPPSPPPSETPTPEPETAPAPEQTTEEVSPPPPVTPAPESSPTPESIPETAINNEAEPENLEILADIPSAEAASEPTVKSNEASSAFTSLASIREVKLESRVRVRGTVIATPAISTGQIFYIADEQAGVQIYSSKKDFPELSIGALIEVTGTVGEANNERRVRISAPDAIKVLGRGAIPSATEVAIANLADALVGRLVRLSGTVVARTSSGFTIEDESGELAIYLGEKSGVAAPREDDEVAIVGVLGRSRQNYRLIPRGPEDLTTLSAAAAAPPQLPAKSAHPVAAPILMGGAAVALGLWGRKDMALRAFRAMNLFVKKK